MFDFKFNWDPRLELDIAQLDQQHQHFFKIGRSIEQYLICSCSGATEKDLLSILYELRDFVTYHFFDEENYMVKIGFPDQEAHRKQHQEFARYINKIDYERLCEKPQEALSELKGNLVSWIFTHMVNEDQKIKDYINAQKIE